MAESIFDRSLIILKKRRLHDVRVEPGKGRFWFGLRERFLCALGIPAGEEIEAVFVKS